MDIGNFQPKSHHRITKHSGEYLRLMVPRYNKWLSQFPYDQWARRLEATNQIVDLYDVVGVDRQIQTIEAIDNGAYVDVYNLNYKYPTALTLAACDGDTDFIHELLKRGADIDHPAGEEHGMGPPLYAAYYQDNFSTALDIIKRGADLRNPNGLHFARRLFTDCTEVLDLDVDHRREILLAVLAMDQSIETEWDDYEDTRRELQRTWSDCEDILERVDEIFIHFDRFFAGCRRRALAEIPGRSGGHLDDDSRRPAM